MDAIEEDFVLVDRVEKLEIEGPSATLPALPG